MAEDSAHWTFDKRISLSHMLTTLTLVAGMAYYGNSLQDQVAQNTHDIKHERELRQSEAKVVKDAIRENKEQYQEINRKLDKLIERHLDQKK